VRPRLSARVALTALVLVVALIPSDQVPVGVDAVFARTTAADLLVGAELAPNSAGTRDERPAGPQAGSPAAEPNVVLGAADAVLIAAGDIASCASGGDERTADLLDRLPGTVVTLGDNAYQNGTPGEFASCFAPSWGRHRDRIRPAPGNHDYATRGAAGYFGYFGAAAGEPSRGYYSYDLGSWHIVALNSNCWAVGGCHAGSQQERWLRADLAANPRACTLAYWHHARFSSGPHGSDTTTAALFQALYDAGADVVLAGHDHIYERFAPQDPHGGVAPGRGIRQFVVGTGGRSLYAVGARRPNSEVAQGHTFGVLKLTLRASVYEWEFVPIVGAAFRDSGSAGCVGA
jgi:hypothetical protein